MDVEYVNGKGNGKPVGREGTEEVSSALPFFVRGGEGRATAQGNFTIRKLGVRVLL